nr:MAG TPA: N-acetyltransferase [Caudoviricetes sp.]
MRFQRFLRLLSNPSTPPARLQPAPPVENAP